MTRKHGSGRPERDVTIEYYFRSIDLVPDGDICDILESQRAEADAFLESLPETSAGHQYAASVRSRTSPPGTSFITRPSCVSDT